MPLGEPSSRFLNPSLSMATGTATPDTKTLEVEDDILHWANEDFFISAEQAKRAERHVENALGRAASHSRAHQLSLPATTAAPLLHSGTFT